jgi:hypothetical protein
MEAPGFVLTKRALLEVAPSIEGIGRNHLTGRCALFSHINAGRIAV